jgi:hypothetical protein
MGYAGSYPRPPQGLHLRIRLNAFQHPANGPYFLIASIAYWLHEGVNRQCPPSSCPNVAR